MRIVTLTVLFFSAANYSDSPPTRSFDFSKMVYWGAGALFDTSSYFAEVGCKICQMIPIPPTIADELLLFSQLCKSSANYIFSQMIKQSSLAMDPQCSWQKNREFLSKIPTPSVKNEQLLYFLQERWLAKMAGFSPLAIQWVYPCFGINMQANPLTNHSYSRLLTTNLSNAYIHRREAWKQSLPHPLYFPLLLTRPANIQEYLPSCIEILPNERIPSIVKRLTSKLREEKGPIVMDVTHLGSLSNDHEEADIASISATSDRLKMGRYGDSPNSLNLTVHGIDPSRIICIQRMHQEEIGGLRILPLPGQSLQQLEEQHWLLLDWIACFGLTANRVELDRSTALTIAPNRLEEEVLKLPTSEKFSKEEFLFRINAFEQAWQGASLDQSILLQGTFQVLKGLFADLQEEIWLKVAECPLQSSLIRFSLHQILTQWELVTQKKKTISLFDLGTHLEQIHSHLSTLLEIFSPFMPAHFHPIYLDLLPIPPPLKSLTSCALHSSAMTSLAGIFKAVQKTVGRLPHILYGDNTYFECIGAAQKMGSATSVEQASEKEWEQADLLLAQFNPVLKLGIHPEYKIENISEQLHRALQSRKRIPLTLAIDCTIDFLNSPKIAQLLQEFQREIEEGILNVIAYRSGNKFDLLGMDNYSGAPLFMIHNQDPKWDMFNSLLIDPVLQTDRLSLHWFCLAYRHAAPQIELYRKQIFDNTRALLDKLPPRLLHQTANYRVPAFEEGAEAAFIDIQVTGPFHRIKAAALVAGNLFLKSMEGGHPIFNRPSLGFYHPNFTMLFVQDSSCIRLTLGLDPTQVDLFADCLKTIDRLNGK